MRAPERTFGKTAALILTSAIGAGCASSFELSPEEQARKTDAGTRAPRAGDAATPGRTVDGSAPDSSLPPPDQGEEDAGAPRGGPDASSCGGKTGARRGLTRRAVDVQGALRTYLVYVPQDLDPDRPAPLVFLHHGFTMSGQAMHDITQISGVADQKRFIVSFPDGQAGPNAFGAPWNVGTNVCGNGALATASGDDFAFLEAMRADIESDQCVDREHVFVAGFSMGGYFAHHIACTRPDLARAIAPHSGGTHDLGACPGGPKPVIMFHGTADTVIDVRCATQARDAWAVKNGCSPDFDRRGVVGGLCEWSRNCPTSGQVVLCLFDGMGHGWAGGDAAQGYDYANYASATELLWSFFEQHAW